MISHRENVPSMQKGPSHRVKREPHLPSKDCSQVHTLLWTGQTLVTKMPGCTCLCSGKGVFDVPGLLATRPSLVSGFHGQRPACAWRDLALPQMNLATLGKSLNLPDFCRKAQTRSSQTSLQCWRVLQIAQTLKRTLLFKLNFTY